MTEEYHGRPPLQRNIDLQSDKHRKPDHYVQVEMQQSNGRKKLMDIGELWEGKNGYQTGHTIYGRMVIQPREQRETLLQMREQKAQSVEHSHSKEIKP